MSGFQFLPQASEASAALQANLAQETDAVTSFLVAFHSQINRPLQHARCLVESYPLCPDALAMANVLGASPASPV